MVVKNQYKEQLDKILELLEKNNPSWKKTLLGIYNLSPSTHIILPHGKMGFLQHNNLVKGIQHPRKLEMSLYSLTKKGFEVAFELEKQKNNKAYNFTITLFTSILAFYAIIIIFINKISRGIAITTLIFIIIVFVIYLKTLKKLE